MPLLAVEKEQGWEEAEVMGAEVGEGKKGGR